MKSHTLLDTTACNPQNGPPRDRHQKAQKDDCVRGSDGEAVGVGSLSEVVTWSGCYEVLVTERSQQFGRDGIYGAFVNVVVQINSEEQFRELAAEALDQEGFQVLDVQDVAQISLTDSGLPEEELDLILESLSGDSPVAFGYFHSYPKKGLDG